MNPLAPAFDPNGARPVHPPTGAPSPQQQSPRTPLPGTELQDSLAAYIEVNDGQRRILDADAGFRAFQRRNPWARVVTDEETIAALEAAYEQRRLRYQRIEQEALQALARAGNTEPIRLHPVGLNPSAAEFQPGQRQGSQGGQGRRVSLFSQLGHERQGSQGSQGGHGRHVSHSSPLGHGRQTSQGSPGGQGGQGGHGHQSSQ